MHESTFPFWVIVLLIGAAFAYFVGYASPYVTKESREEVKKYVKGGNAIRPKIIIKNRTDSETVICLSVGLAIVWMIFFFCDGFSNLIMRLGLYKNKAKNLSLLAKKVVEDFGGEIPNSREALTSLPGVGIKTSNVVRAECFGVPAIAVDTHVARVSYRLGYCKEGEDPVKIESILERRFPKEKWIKLHHQIIWFGRLVCHARNPECDKCPLMGYCRYFKKVSSKTGK